MSGPVQIWTPSAIPRLSPHHHGVVEASAGTGKTFLLQHLFVDRILNGHATIDQLLVVTYTEKATQELRQRIHAQLHQAVAGVSPRPISDAHWTIDGESRARLRHAIQHFDQSNISTIHAFCNQLLTRFAFTNGHAFEREQLPTETIFRPAFVDLIRDSQHNIELKRYFDAWDGSLETLLTTLRVLLNRPAVAAPSASPTFVEQSTGSLIELAEEHFPTQEALEKIIQDSGCLKRSAGKLRGALQQWSDIAKSDAHWLTQFAELSPVLDEVAPRIKSPTQGAAQLASRLQELRPKLPFAKTYIAQQLLPRISDKLGVLKEQLGVFDFGDMLTEALELVRNASPDALEHIRQGLRYVFIDEFQDTDPIQWEFFQRLFVDSSTTKVTVVGDPKQAIYSFRGADVATYHNATQQLLEQGAKKETLDTNFRSSRQLIKATNYLLTTPSPLLVDVTFHPAKSGTTQIGLSPAIIAFENDGSDNTAMLRYMTNEIVTLENDSQQALNEIFVLTRTTKESNEVLAALAAAKIPATAYKQEGLTESQVALDLFDLLTAICTPTSTRAKLNALRTPFFNVQLDELAGGKNATNYQWDTLFFFWNSLGEKGALEELFEDVLDRTQIVEQWISTGDTQAITNLYHLIERLCQQQDRELSKLTALLGHWRMDPIRLREGNLQRTATDMPAVQVMTMHASKGLEAPVVFLYTNSKGVSNSLKFFHDSDGLLRFEIAKTKPLQSRRPKHDDAYRTEQTKEGRRLQYVAITRAQSRTYLPVWKKSTGEYSELNDRLATLNDPNQLLIRSSVSASIDVPRSNLPSPPFIHPRLTVPESDLFPRIVSYSGLQQLIGTEHPQVDKSKLAITDLPPGANSGLFVHALLEHLPWRSLFTPASLFLSWEQWKAIPEVTSLCDELGQAYGFSSAVYDSALSMCYRTLTQPFAPDTPPLGKLRKLKREFTFYARLDSRTLLHGIYDIVVEHDGLLFLIDYKTNVLPDYTNTTVNDYTEKYYRLQKEVYCVSLAALCAQSSCEIGGISYLYCRGRTADNGLFFMKPDSNQLKQWTRHLLELIS